MNIALERPLSLYDAYLFDLDGTIYLGDELLPGAARLIAELRSRDIPVRFLTNNPTRTREDYATKLTALGIPTPVAEIANSVRAVTSWILQHHPGATVFPIAESPVVAALQDAGIRISDDPSQIDIVLASYDRNFDYQKLQIAFDAIWQHRRAILVGTNPDRYCPFPGGRGEPDCAAIVAAIEASTGVQAHIVMGKPDPNMVTEALRGTNVDPRNCVMVGDRLGTDIELALRADLASVLTLTGDSTLHDVESIAAERRPSFIVNRVDQILPEAVWRELGWDSGGHRLRAGSVSCA